MSSFLCFICHSTVNDDTTEEMREKYREVIGMNLCPDSHLCHICCHVMNRLWLFRSVCLKRSLEYPVLFSEKGTLNLQRNDLEIHTVCFEDCDHYKSRNINSKYYHFTFFDDTLESGEKSNSRNDYCELEDERQEFDEFSNNKINYHADSAKDVQSNDFLNDNDDYNHNENGECNMDYNVSRDFEKEIGEEFVIKNDCRLDLDEKRKEIEVEKNNETEKRDVDLEHEHQEDFNEGEQSLASEDEECYENDTQMLEREVGPPELDPQLAETVEKLDPDEPLIKKKKKKKSKKEKHKNKKRFEKFILSVEEQRSELEVKRKDKKYIEAEFKCFACAIGFLFKDTYQTHMMRHEESNGEFQCSICSLRFATQAVLRAHTALHAERHRCLQCGTILRRRQRTQHLTQCYQLQTTPACCHICGRVFKNGAGLQQHWRRFHQQSTGRAHACAVCGERGDNPAAIRTHMIKHIQRKFPCPECPRSFSSPYTLREHSRSHAADGAGWVCTCGAALSSEKGLRRHRARAQVHAQTSFECPVCGRACPSPRALRAHAAAAHGAAHGTARAQARPVRARRPRPARPALCHLCGGSFKGNSKLNRHLREVCEKDKLEEELSSYYAQDTGA